MRTLLLSESISSLSFWNEAGHHIPPLHSLKTKRPISFPSQSPLSASCTRVLNPSKPNEAVPPFLQALLPRFAPALRVTSPPPFEVCNLVATQFFRRDHRPPLFLLSLPNGSRRIFFPFFSIRAPLRLYARRSQFGLFPTWLVFEPRVQDAPRRMIGLMTPRSSSPPS